MPKYQRIATELQAEIKQGVYPAGQMLPTEEQLTQRFSASRQTIRQALSLLVEAGLITKQRGSGSRVRAGATAPRSGNIAVIATYISDYIFPGILREAQSVFAANQYSAILSATRNSVYHERTILNDLLSKPIDGILVEGTKTALPNPNLDLYQKLMERNIPIVFFNGFYADLENTISVYADNFGGGYQLVQHLLQKGHEKIAGIFKSDDIQGHERYSGYITALRDAGRMISDSSVFWYTTESRDEMFTQELAHKIAECSAVVCYNDEIAFRLIPLLLQHGVRIPQDVAVVSFDNSALSELSPVKITSLSYGAQNIGHVAAETLLARIEGNPAQSQTLRWTLVEKDSSK
jgi:GntR family transcriptional regulator of arabinose operon